MQNIRRHKKHNVKQKLAIIVSKIVLMYAFLLFLTIYVHVLK